MCPAPLPITPILSRHIPQSCQNCKLLFLFFEVLRLRQTDRQTDTSTHTYGHTHARAHTHTHKHGHTHTRARGYTQGHTDKNTRTHTHALTHKHIHTRTHRHKHTDTRAHGHTRTRTQAHAHARARAHTHTHGHLQLTVPHMYKQNLHIIPKLQLKRSPIFAKILCFFSNENILLKKRPICSNIFRNTKQTETLQSELDWLGKVTSTVEQVILVTATKSRYVPQQGLLKQTNIRLLLGHIRHHGRLLHLDLAFEGMLLSLLRCRTCVANCIPSAL